MKFESKNFLHMYDTYNCDLSAVQHISFQLNRFSAKCRFLFPILHFFTVKSLSVTQRSVSQENAFKKLQNPVAFFFSLKTIGSNNSLTLIENNFGFFMIAKYEFKVTTLNTEAYGQNAPSCDP